jgi:hypothetical protein
LAFASRRRRVGQRTQRTFKGESLESPPPTALPS